MGLYEASPGLRSLLLSLRMDGLRSTLRRVWVRLFGADGWYIFVRYLEPPSTPVEFPIEANGVTLRRMTEGDLDDVARLLPFDLHRRPFRQRRERLVERLGDAVVATRAGRIVGAAWYTDQVTPEQPWYEVIEGELIWPAKLTAGIFVVPGEKAAAWVIAKHAAGERLATIGIRSVVSMVRAHNKPALLIARLVGARLVARMSVRHRWGRTTTAVERVHDEQFSDSQMLKAAGSLLR